MNLVKEVYDKIAGNTCNKNIWNSDTKIKTSDIKMQLRHEV